MANSVSHAALPYPIKGCRFTIAVPYLDADGDPTDPTTPDTERSIDAAAFADCTEEATTISGSNGTAYITLTGDEMNCSLLALAAKVASGPKATLATIYPRILPVFRSGTAQAGAAGTITLDSGASAVDDFYNGMIVRTTGGTGGGGGSGSLGNQARLVTDYAGSTKVATVVPNWETNPSSDTTFEILLTPEALIRTAVLSPQVHTSATVPTVTTVAGNVDGNVTGSIGSLATQAKADVNAEVDSALNTAIPGSPTADSINERIKAVDDKLPSGTISDFDEASNKVTLAEVTHTNAVIPTVSVLTGHTAQTGDSFAKLGTISNLGGGATIGANLSDMAGATFSTGTDSQEAIRDRGDAAWTTGAGGSDRLLMVDTTIASLSSQTSFTLTSGSGDDDAYNNCTIVIEDAATATQKAVGLISDYTGSTKTVTLKYDPSIFTMATTDKIYILAEGSLKTTAANRQLNVGASGSVVLVDTVTTNVDMRGTDSAALAAVCTEGRLARLDAGSLPADVAAVKTDTAAVKVKTDGLNFTGADVKATLDGETVTLAAVTHTGAVIQTVTNTGTVTGNVDGSIGSLATQAKADVNAEVDAALNTAVPGSPVSDSINERVKTLDDNYTVARSAKLDNADVATSTRADAAEYTSTRAAKIDNLDVAVSTRAPSGNQTVGGYAAGQNPADHVLVTPAQKLVTDASGRVDIGAVNGDSTAAILLRLGLLTEREITATGGSQDAPGMRTTIECDLTNVSDGQYNGRRVLFEHDTVTGDLRRQAARVIMTTGGVSGELLVEILLSAPASGDKFLII